MAKVVVAYPKLAKKDFNWIQSIRADHDELYYNVIDPHYTIVFPIFNQINEKDLILHVREKAKTFKPINFTLNKTILNKDAFNEYWHGLVIPEKGYDDIVRLHDEIYAGLLKPELRFDIPYIPHIGIASSKDKDKIQKVVEGFNQQNINIQGTINTLDICDYEDEKVTSNSKIHLFLTN